MKKKSMLFLFFFSTNMVFIFSCLNADNTQMDSVQNIKDYKVTLPETEGYDLFEANCITCHSLRYIEMQPDFPQKTWENIVYKMIKVYGSPIPDSTAQIIVKYLTEVKGIH